MQSLPAGYHALVIGASGAIGGALVRQLRSDPLCDRVLALSRRSEPTVDFEREETITEAAAHLRDQGPLHLIVLATGMLHGPEPSPEKRLSQLRYDRMLASFTVNTFGPALTLAHFAPLLARDQRSLFGVLSARVGSIGDNRLGGWYSYRASKAALNMMLRTASIELARTHPLAVLMALHPGTVDSPLSAPFQAPHGKRSPDQAAADLLRVLDAASTAETGGFRAYDGQKVPW